MIDAKMNGKMQNFATKNLNAIFSISNLFIK